MKLSQYARREGIKYRSAWVRYKKGRIPGAYLDNSGHVVVPDPDNGRLQSAVVYARVSSAKQKADLDSQAERMVTFANNAGLSVKRVVKEIASGVNDKRPKLTALLMDEDWGTLVVEHKDRLTRVGFEWFRVLLHMQGKRILVANEAEDDKTDLMNDFTSIIYSFAARLYGVRGARNRTNRAVKAFTDEGGSVEE